MVKDEDELLPLNELPTGLDPDRLTAAFLKMLSRMKNSETSSETLISPIVKAKPVPVRKMAGNILTFVREKKKASVVTLLAGATTRGELVASFIALLELIKQKVLLLCETEEQAERGDIDYSISLMLNPDADSSGVVTEYDGDEAEKENENE
jgi:chromatin segregation and condensation protein Rec8/ScpA/Scc1 (kleisin family)